MLIQAKAQVEHGEFGKWIEENFNLTMRSAQNFMRVAERFGNSNTSWKFNSSQMWEMLALPAEETEKFIAEQTANDNPVEDMSVRELKTKVAQYIVELKVGLL